MVTHSRDKWLLAIALLVGVGLAFRAWRDGAQEQRPSSMSASHQVLPPTDDSPQAQSISPIENSTRSGPSVLPADKIAPPAHASAADSGGVSPRFSNKREFINKFKTRPAADWWSEGEVVTEIDHPNVGFLNIAHEAGVFEGPSGRWEYRYEVGGLNGKPIFAESCVSILPPDKKLVLGIFGEGSLVIRKTKIDSAFMMLINKKYLFVRYFDRTPEAQYNEHHEPTSPETYIATLLFEGDGAGPFRYLGEMTTAIYPDANLRLYGLDFCQYAFDR